MTKKGNKKMNEIYDDSYLDDETDDLIWKYQGIDEFTAVKDLSRQLRSFLKFKEQVVKYRFRSSFTPPVNRDIPKFTKDENALYEIASKFIKILKQIKKDAESIAQGIQNHAMNPNSSLLCQLIDVMKKLFILIHKFSEQELYDHSQLLKFIVSLAREAYLVNKYLDLETKEFLLELELGYEELEEDMEEMLSQRDQLKYKNAKKQLEERLRS
jgi:hypothetical protein